MFRQILKNKRRPKVLSWRLSLWTSPLKRKKRWRTNLSRLLQQLRGHQDTIDTLDEAVEFWSPWPSKQCCFGSHDILSDSQNSSTPNSQSASTYDAPMQKQMERLEMDMFPNPSTFAFWKMSFRSEVCSGSCHPSYAMIWISEIDLAKSVEDSRTSRSTPEKTFPILRRSMRRSRVHWRNYSPRVTSARKCSLKNRRQNEERFLRGRQIAFIFRITGTGESILDFCDLVGVSHRRHNVQGFDTKWDEVLLSMKNFRRWHSGTFIQDETQRFRTIGVYFGIVYSRYKAKKEKTQIHSTGR